MAECQFSGLRRGCRVLHEVNVQLRVQLHIRSLIGTDFVVIGGGENRYHFTLVDHFVALGLALVRPDHVHQLVALREPSGDIGAEVTTRTPQRIRFTALRVLRITPQDVKHLRG